MNPAALHLFQSASEIKNPFGRGVKCGQAILSYSERTWPQCHGNAQCLVVAAGREKSLTASQGSLIRGQVKPPMASDPVPMAGHCRSIGRAMI